MKVYIIFFLLLATCAKALIVFESYDDGTCQKRLYQTSAVARAGLPAEAQSTFYHFPLLDICLDLHNTGLNKLPEAIMYSAISTAGVTYCHYNDTNSDPLAPVVCETPYAPCVTVALNQCVQLMYTGSTRFGWGKFIELTAPGYMVLRGRPDATGPQCPYPPTFPVFSTFMHQSSPFGCTTECNGRYVYHDAQGTVRSCSTSPMTSTCNGTQPMCQFGQGECETGTGTFNGCVTWKGSMLSPVGAVAYGGTTGSYSYMGDAVQDNRPPVVPVVSTSSAGRVMPFFMLLLLAHL